MTPKSIFFSLIRSSLWQTLPEGLPFNISTTQWDEIGRIATEQTVGPLVFNAVFSLHSDQRPTKDWIFKAYSFLERNRRTHELLDKTASEVAEKLKDEGIRSVLLKGQAYARAYPISSLRQCGDIDIYVGEDQYRSAYEATKKLDWESKEKFHRHSKHYGFTLNGVRIELHSFAGQLVSKASDKRFQAWSRHELKSTCDTLLIEGKPILVPTPIFDVIFVFLHMYHHFIFGGIGLRQVCDWTMLLHKHSKEIDKVKLRKLLEDFKLLKAWQRFTPIAVGYLGLPENECPFYSKKYQKEADEILSFILKEGNFGRALQSKKERPNDYWAGKWYSLRVNTARHYSKLKIDPSIVIKSYSKFLRSGIKGVIKDILHIRR